jgi:oleandomycin transport system ATP-binding protein
VTVGVADPGVVPALVRELDDKGIAVEELTLRKPSLDEVFLSLTGSAPSQGPTTRTQETAGSTL